MFSMEPPCQVKLASKFMGFVTPAIPVGFQCQLDFNHVQNWMEFLGVEMLKI